MTDQKKIDELHELIEDIEIAMLTTRRPDGRLVSRPMATQKHEAIADLWYVTDIESNKMNELESDPHVNLGFFDTKSSEWVSVSGIARVSTDRDMIRELYESDWKIWFGEVDDVRDGGPDDPRLALILVDADSVTYMKSEKSQPAVLFEIAKGAATGERPDVGEVRSVSMQSR